MFLSELRQDGHTVCKTPALIIILKLLFRDRTVRALRGGGAVHIGTNWRI